MVKKFFFLLLVNLPLLVIGAPGGKRKVYNDPKIAFKTKLQKKDIDELRRRVGDASSPLGSYARLINSNKSSGVSGTGVLCAGLSLAVVCLLMPLIQ